MRILYGAPASVFVRKVKILLIEKNLEYVNIPINPMLELPQEFKKISPLGKIPVYQEDGYILSDSSAICAYLDAKYSHPSFYPKNPELLGRTLWLEEFADSALFQATAACYYQTVLVRLYRERAPDAQAIDSAIAQQLPPMADYLEKELGVNEFLIGDFFTIADVSVSCILMNVYLSGYELSFKKWPNLTHYLERIFNRASFRICELDVKKEISKLACSSY